MQRLIGLGGLAGSGKDAIAQILVNNHDFVRVAFADKLKEMLLAIDPYVKIDFEEFDSESRYVKLSDIINGYISEYGMHFWEAYNYSKEQIPDVRRLLQRIGTEGGRNLFGENFWVNLVQPILDQNDSIVITDVRFPNESDFVHLNNGIVVLVERPGVVRINNHSSEDLNIYPDAILNNDGTLEDLDLAVDELVAGLPEQLTWT